MHHACNQTVQVSWLSNWIVGIMCVHCCYDAFCRINCILQSYNEWLVCFSNFVTVLMNWQQDFVLPSIVCNCTHNEHVGLLFGGHPILLITQITHQIGFYRVPLPLPVILYNQQQSLGKEGEWGERFVIPKKIDPCCHVFIQCYNTLDLLWKF